MPMNTATRAASRGSYSPAAARACASALASSEAGAASSTRRLYRAAPQLPCQPPAAGWVGPQGCSLTRLLRHRSHTLRGPGEQRRLLHPGEAQRLGCCTQLQSPLSAIAVDHHHTTHATIRTCCCTACPALRCFCGGPCAAAPPLVGPAGAARFVPAPVCAGPTMLGPAAAAAAAAAGPASASSRSLPCWLSSSTRACKHGGRCLLLLLCWWWWWCDDKWSKGGRAGTAGASARPDLPTVAQCRGLHLFEVSPC